MNPKSIYSLHPAYKMEAAYTANLLARTGKTMEEWVEVVKQEGPATEKERRDWLKATHGFTTNYAWWVAEVAAGKGTGADQYDPDAYVEAMFAGKPTLRPLYDRLLKLGLSLGKDVKACPCETIVPLFREHVFAQLKPTTKTRLDLGLSLRGTPFTGRLLDTGGTAKKDRITHRIGVTSLADIDDEVKYYLRMAYELAEPGAKKPAKPKGEVVVPADLAEASAASPSAQAAFAKLPPSHRREHVEAIEEAKKPETRARRIAKAVEMLTKKKD
ncbi:MAG: YdeI/OmpD-associated family protein [Gemmataceae bacterium]